MSQAPEAVSHLVERFARNAETYKNPTYNETQVRREFIDPFFKALGWDVDNEQGYAEAYKDVIHEDAIKVGGVTKAPDYCFRIGGTRKFFLEAKKPAIPLKDHAESAFQLRRYAWSAKLPLSILTDFEELAVYDCRIRPRQTDKSSASRTMYFTYDEYEDRWDELASVFSRDAVLKGSFDKYAQSKAKKRGTTEVDAEFLREIERWRELLARNFALRNPRLSVRDLNFAVQRTIDRIIFLRMCEDRNVEPYGELQALRNGIKVYARLGELFRRADERYNSSLFYFTPEKGREPPDELTLALKLDDQVLKDIIGDLYYPDSPYEFSVLPPEILGQVYEQFLGKVIRLTEGHHAKVEEKPEVKKAGGVYYTPTYIVDYIVKNTVGKLLDGKTPKQVGPDPPKRSRRQTEPPPHSEPRPSGSGTRGKTHPLRILDPACGSGSFLLGAYRYLLDWHRDWYLDDGPAKHTDRIYQGLGGQWRLTVQEKKRILVNNIYGVDIDAQAVEVTKLSLLLKVLEGETAETIGQTLRLFHERALPDLSHNIKCGNSLIGPDFYENQQMSLLDDEERYRINVFDWQAEFPEVFMSGSAPIPNRAREEAAKGTRNTHKPLPDGRGSDQARHPNPGFDAVIGNPPYDVMEKERGKSSWPHVALSDYVRTHTKYQHALGGKLNLFRFFLVRALALLRKHGRFGMIVPLALLADISCARTRRHVILSMTDLLADCFPQKDNANRRVFFGAKLSTLIMTGDRKDSLTEGESQLRVRVYPWNSFEDNSRECVVRLVDASLIDPRNTPIPLVDDRDWQLCQKIHLAPHIIRLGDTSDARINRGEINQTIYRKFITPDENMQRLLKGVEIGQYHLHKRLSQGEREWFNESLFLESNKPKVNVGKTRIATQRITGVDERLRIVATIIDPPTYFADSTNSILLIQESSYALEYLLGLLNSTLFQWRFRLTSTNNNVGTNELECMPFRTIDFSGSIDRAHHDHMVELVQQMLDLHKRLVAAKTPDEKTRLQRQIDATDRRIDQLVYELYNLTDEEIKIVEGATEVTR